MTLSYRILHTDTSVLVDQQKLHPFCGNTVCHLDDLPRVMADRDGWKERVKEIHAVCMTSG